MSEIINIEVTADPSGADEALKQVNKSLKEGTEAAEALNHVLDGDLAGAFKSLGELSKTLGVDLSLAFSPAEIIAFVQVIADVTDKLSKLIADTFIYTDAMKGQDAGLKSANKSLADNAARVKALDRATQIAAAQGLVAKEKLRLAFTLEDLGGDPKKLRDKLDQALDDLKKARAEVDRVAPSNVGGAGGPVLWAPTKGSTLAITSLDKATEEANLKVTTLENSVNAYNSAIKVAEAETSNTSQTIKNGLAGGAEKAANKAEELHTKFVSMVYAERQAMQDKAAAHETAEAQETITVLSETEKQNQAIIKAANEQLAVWDEGYKGQIEVAKIASEQKIQLIEQDLLKGKLNKQQAIAQIAQEKERELEIEKLTQQKRWALWDGDKKKQQEIQNQINKIVAQAQNVETKAVTDSLKAREQQYKQVFSQIGNALKTNVPSMLEGTETITQGFQKMYQSLLSSLADYIAQKAEKKAEEWAIDKLFHTKSVVAETGAATGKAMTAAFASVMSALPFPANVATAPGVAAAAGAQATGLGLAGLAAMFELGGIVPQDGLAYLHKDEKIIPASKSGTGAGLEGIGGITVVVNHSVSAVDAESFQGHIRRHGNMIANEVTRALKRKGIGK